MAFSGTDGHVVVPSSTTLDMATGGTIELWVRLNNSNGVGSTTSRGTGAGDNDVLMNSSCGNMQTIFQYSQQSTNVTSACNAITLNMWTHIAVVNNGTTLTLYINGTPNTTAAGGLMGPLTSDLYLGRRSQGLFALDGDLDEVKWWTVVRTPQEICTDAGGTPVGALCTLTIVM
jgi:biopolymer transport protein ExbB